MTWEIFLGISTLVAFMIAVGTIISKASQSVATLNATINILSETLKEFKTDSKTEHKEMHDKIEDHETRIGILEIKANVPKK
jgi:uncharacterized protein YlxW (UPF0749 family)